MVFDDDLWGEAGDGVVAMGPGLELVSEFFQHRLEGRSACELDVRLRPGASAFAGPTADVTARHVRAFPDHGLFSSAADARRC